MSSIGPSLPPHLAKRKRSDGEDDVSASPQRSSSPDSEKRRRVVGPAAPPRTLGPTLPPRAGSPRSRSSSEDSDLGPALPTASKPARVLGPAPPPAPLSERPPNPPSDDSDSDSSDDDFGPAPPPAGGFSSGNGNGDGASRSAFDVDPQYVEETKKVVRDEWMMLPPTADGLAARMDPTKSRPRKFNSGKASNGPTAGETNAWTETPEQKLKRLQNEALGISAPATATDTKKDSRRAREEEAKARKIREKIEASRGKSLMEQHTEAETGKEKEDDPSKRAFDYQKDMAGGAKIGNKQRRDLLDNAKGFGGRFSSGSFL
ncbi:hypothetical protein P154DRAFT_280809 [Amniculicola lignicola CBS 123094]|uniref:DUF3752 domain-containing protein n=1 Tax=Amniculicola lignicola CBS 123094 TaxID=1392246 RepID=A0A6A5W6Q2_9PLEO|nr:hypothetical protein P154DRAFT_280809 [Amniculicola lignicola CBS 123094]